MYITQENIVQLLSWLLNKREKLRVYDILSFSHDMDDGELEEHWYSLFPLTNTNKKRLNEVQRISKLVSLPKYALSISGRNHPIIPDETGVNLNSCFYISIGIAKNFIIYEGSSYLFIKLFITCLFSSP